MSPSSTPIWNDNTLRDLHLSPRFIHQKKAAESGQHGAVEQTICPFHHQQ
jgi:nitric-oxide synthase